MCRTCKRHNHYTLLAFSSILTPILHVFPYAVISFHFCIAFEPLTLISFTLLSKFLSFTFLQHICLLSPAVLPDSFVNQCLLKCFSFLVQYIILIPLPPHLLFLVCSYLNSFSVVTLNSMFLVNTSIFSQSAIPPIGNTYQLNCHQIFDALQNTAKIHQAVISRIYYYVDTQDKQQLAFVPVLTVTRYFIPLEILPDI